MIWFILAIMAAIVALLLATVRGPKGQAPGALAHYKAQLAELADDEARGVIEASAAGAARLEIERRILKVADHTPAMALDNSRDSLPWLLAILVVSGAFAFYLMTGQPDLPAKPGRVVEARAQLIEEGSKSYGDSIDLVQKRLITDPDDQKALQVLAKLAIAVGEPALAADAYARLAQLDPNALQWRVHEFEAFMAMANGRITPAAQLLLQRLLADAPEHPAVQYYLGLAYDQAGRADDARAVWQALADRSAPDAPWQPRLRAQLARLGVKPPSLSGDQMQAVANMDPADREVFIRAMMDRLAAKLEAEPDDPEGWLMLARSHLAMGNREAAVAALSRGIDQVAPDKRAPLQAFLDNMTSKADP